MNSVGIIDLGYGNLGSLYNAISEITYNVVVSQQYKVLKKYDILILPGVGSAGVFAKNFKKTGLKNFILQHTQNNKQLIAICLGFHFLFSFTTEDGGVEGLNIFPQKVTKILNRSHYSSRTGWFKVSKTRQLGIKNNSSFFYFNNSYGIKVEKNNFKNFGSSSSILAWIKKNNIVGLQFHPEKSQLNGKIVLNYLVNR